MILLSLAAIIATAGDAAGERPLHWERRCPRRRLGCSETPGPLSSRGETPFGNRRGSVLSDAELLTGLSGDPPAPPTG